MWLRARPLFSRNTAVSEQNDFAAEFPPRHSYARNVWGTMLHQYDPTLSRRFQPWAYVMPSDHAAAGLMLKMITIRLAAEAAHYDPDARYQLALGLLAAALIEVRSSISPAWTVQPLPSDPPLLYQLTPLQEHAVSNAAAWEMTEALRRQAEVAHAQPVFVTLLNNHRTPRDRP
jgi:hypothetical protein